LVSKYLPDSREGRFRAISSTNRPGKIKQGHEQKGGMSSAYSFLVQDLPSPVLHDLGGLGPLVSDWPTSTASITWKNRKWEAKDGREQRDAFFPLPFSLPDVNWFFLSSQLSLSLFQTTLLPCPCFVSPSALLTSTHSPAFVRFFSPLEP